MCLSSVYMHTGNEEKEIMKDIASVEAEGNGFWFIDLFGERQFIEGRIEAINLLDGHLVVLNDKTSG
ncbi:MAG: CooT family nickel-binding protein [Deltaproteobacteria bacterium]|nr:CooT family nickel-binding protein [Deltaproteobacteria bacterium]